MKINESSGSEKQVLATGFYVCLVTDMIDKPDNEWEGELKPQVSFALQPLNKLGSVKPMVDTEGEEFSSFKVYKDKEGNETKRANVVYYNMTYKFHNGEPSMSTDERSGYYALKTAVFQDIEKQGYENLEDYIGDTVVVEIVAKKNSKGSIVNRVKGISNHEDNTIKTKEEITKVVAQWEKNTAEREARMAEKEANTSIDDLPA